MTVDVARLGEGGLGRVRSTLLYTLLFGLPLVLVDPEFLGVASSDLPTSQRVAFAAARRQFRRLPFSGRTRTLGRKRGRLGTASMGGSAMLGGAGTG